MQYVWHLLFVLSYHEKSLRYLKSFDVSENFLTILAMLGFAFASENCGGQNMIRRHCKFCFWSLVGAAVSWCSFCKVGREMISWTHNLPPCRAYKDKDEDEVEDKYRPVLPPWCALKTNTQTKRCHISHIFSSYPIVNPNPNPNPMNSKRAHTNCRNRDLAQQVLSRMHF